MGKWKPCKRRDFIKKLKKLGFEAPEPGGRHFYMRYVHIHLHYQVIKNILFHKLRCFLMKLNGELVRKYPFNSGKIFRKLFHIALYVFCLSSTITHGKRTKDTLRLKDLVFIALYSTQHQSSDHGKITNNQYRITISTFQT